MSYYKEAIEGEFNRVEQAAQLHGLSGPDMLGEFVKQMTQSHERASRVLSTSDPSGKLLSCYMSTIVGFIIFQALHPRYKMTDLLGVSASPSFAFGLREKSKSRLTTQLSSVPRQSRVSINHLLYLFFIILSSYLSVIWYPTILSNILVK